MSVRPPLLIAAALLVTAGAALAGPERIKVEARSASVTAAPGDTIEVVFKVDVEHGWHIYAPNAGEGTIPTTIKLDAAPGVASGALEARGGQRDLVIPDVGTYKVLEGTFDLAWKVQVAKDAPLGPRKLTGQIAYEACNDQTCEQPTSVPFTISLDVAAPLVGVGPPIELPASGPVIANLTAPAKVVAGTDAIVELDLFVRPHYHVYAPGTEPESRVTKLELDLPPGFTQGALTAPPPSKSEMDDLGKVNLWEGKVKLARSFSVPANAQGSLKIKARSKWLVCDEKGCAPGRETRELTIEIVPAAGPSMTNGSPTIAAVPSSTPTITSAPSTNEGPGVGALVLTAISLGLINILMPCTLPMIPITISIFSKGKKLSRGQSLLRASVYAAGIIVSFALVGGLIQALFGNSGQGFVRQIAANGPLNLGIAALFVYFALSFFGYYEIELPEFLRAFVEKSVDKAKSSSPNEGGVPIPALFLMGFFFVLTSYTCGAPLILGVLTAGLATPTKGSVILATAVFGATTAFPFFFLALVPGFLKSLPRSGDWFKTFKVTLGTIELAAALKFLQNADAFFGTGLLSREAFLGLWAIAAAFLALYVPGIVKLSHEEPADPDAPKRSKVVTLAWAFPFLFLTGYLLSGLAPNKKLQADLESFVDPGTGHIKIYPSFDKALEAARKTKKPLFLEFSGHT